ncbi:hypothetical protein [Methanoregula sp.]|jgi:hypothetical protein|uniref:hypothetical protein n=1 Tax=Methanoregula sp. TaxID=2052170 RepID=UPI003562CD71
MKNQTQYSILILIIAVIVIGVVIGFTDNPFKNSLSNLGTGPLGTLSLGQTAHLSNNKEVTLTSGHCANTLTDTDPVIGKQTVWNSKNIQFFATVKNTKSPDNKVWKDINTAIAGAAGRVYLSDSEGDLMALSRSGFMDSIIVSTGDKKTTSHILYPGDSGTTEYQFVFSDPQSQEFFTRLQKHAELKMYDTCEFTPYRGSVLCLDPSESETPAATWDVTSAFQTCTGDNTDVHWKVTY